MNTLYHRNREKAAGATGIGPHWIKGAGLTILVGGIAAAAGAFFIQRKDWALGLFLGSLLSLLYFYSLHALAGKILKAGERGGKIFWLWTVLRWVIAALACWGLVVISPSCLFGALGGYLWALAVLGWKGWRAAASAGTSPRQPD